MYIIITETKCNKYLTMNNISDENKRLDNTTRKAHVIIAYVTFWIMDIIWDRFQSNARRRQLHTQCLQVGYIMVRLIF